MQKFNGSVVPMFLTKDMEQPMALKAQTQENSFQTQQAELSVFDVKELYDLAYTYETKDEGKFKALLSEALQLDVAYRRQLAAKQPYKNVSKETDFSDIAESKKTQVA